MGTKEKKLYQMGTNAERVAFMATMPESGMYSGLNEDGDEVLVMREVGKGITVRTYKKEKPLWVEITDYDEAGYYEGTRYESLKEDN